MRLLFTEADEYPLPETARQVAVELGCELVPVAGYERSSIEEAGRSCDGILLLHAEVDGELLDAWPNCRVLARVGTGYDKIDVEEATRRGVTVTFIPDMSSRELADTAMAFLLILGRRLLPMLDSRQGRRWRLMSELQIPPRLGGQTLGILGFGNSGKEMANRARGFGIEVGAWTRTVDPSLLRRYGVESMSFSEALACDFVSIHLPLTTETHQLIGPNEISMMKDGAVLLNIARGQIVDTEALVNALRNEKLGGAGLDVVDPEPLPADHELWAMDNVIITPHSASLSREVMDFAFAQAVRDAVSVIKGSAPQFMVPEQVGRLHVD